MKTRYLSIISSAVLFICLVSAQNLFARDKNSDPINNSYIINNLQMESDTVPAVSDQESGEGEIIFDNTFDDDFSKRAKPYVQCDSKARLKKKFTSDKRLHLTEYKIRRNENLWTIAKKSNTSLDLLIEINNIKNPEHLKENDIIFIPSTKGIFYKIRKGDTLTKISQKFNTEIDIIAEHNNIDGRKIIAGKKIFLPDAEQPERVEPVKIKKSNRTVEPVDKIAVIDKSKEKKSSERVVLAWPLRGPITSGFGIRTHPFSGVKKFHCGLDIGAEVGTPVRSAGEGTVIFSGWKDAYGNMIVVSHKNNYLTIYAHNSKNLVGVNEKIKKGQKIALSGKTGAVTGAHLHFEIRKGIVPLNPSRILK
jgi:murein DD-endopeptidase MepM/ murein hydrolase activator NlpD